MFPLWCVWFPEVYNATESALADMERGACPAECMPKRRKLDRRRLAETWFRWALRNQMEQYNLLAELQLEGLSAKDLDKAIELHRDRLMLKFIQRWGDHRCGTPGGFAPFVCPSFVVNVVL